MVPAAPHAALRVLAHPALWSALAAAVLYLPSLWHGFVWDDHWLIETNPPIHGGRGLGRLLLSDFWAPTGSGSGYWRPAIVLSYWLDGTVSHWRPAWFHAVNLVAHAGVSAAVAALILQSRAPAWAALAGGLWFAAMPHHVESVAWISGRTDLLCALFFLLALWLERRARARRPRPGWAAPGLLGLALLSKEMAVMFLPVVAVALWTEGGGTPGRPGGAPREAWRARLRWLLPYALVCGAWAVVHGMVVAQRALPTTFHAEEVARARWTAITMLTSYLGFLWPWARHTPAARIPLPAGPFAPEVLVSALVQLVLVLSLGVLVARRSRFALPLALFWLTLLPLAGLAAFRGVIVYAERLAYLPSAGLAWALGLGLGSIRGRRAARVAAGVGAVLIGASAVQAGRLLPHWKDDPALFRSMAEAAPRSAVTHANYAMILAQRGRVKEALDEVGRALALDPRHADAYFTRALIHYGLEEWAEAVADADRAIALDPGRMEPRVTRARALLQLGRWEEARAEIEPLLRRIPGNPFVESVWGQLLLAQGSAAEALPYLERAARFITGDPDLDSALAVASAGRGRLIDPAPPPVSPP